MVAQHPDANRPAESVEVSTDLDYVVDLVWPWPLRAAAWGNAVRQGVTSLESFAHYVGVTDLLRVGAALAASTSVSGFLARPGSVPPLALPSAVLPSLVDGGGCCVLLGAESSVWTMTAAGLQSSALDQPVMPPLTTLGQAERELYAAVTAATQVMEALGIARESEAARAVLRRLPMILDQQPLPPSASGRARLLRDRAALLLVGVDLALHPQFAAVTASLNDARQAVLQEAADAARAVLEAVANEHALA